MPAVLSLAKFMLCLFATGFHGRAKRRRLLDGYGHQANVRRARSAAAGAAPRNREMRAAWEADAGHRDRPGESEHQRVRTYAATVPVTARPAHCRFDSSAHA